MKRKWHILEMFSIRWRKVFRDLTSNKSRSLFVVLSIAVGIFATATILGPREVLLREFDADYAASDRASITFSLSDIDSSTVERVQNRSDVVDTSSRRILDGRIGGLRFLKNSSLAEASSSGMGTGDTESWQNLELHAMWDFDDLPNGISNISSQSWPLKKGEIALEHSAAAKFDVRPGDLLEVETDTGSKMLRFVGWMHDLNSVPARFAPLITAYISHETLELLDEPDYYNTLFVKVEPGLSRAEAGLIAEKIQDESLAPYGVSVLRTAVPVPGEHFLGDIFKAVSVLLLAMAIMALALSAFLVITTTSAILVQQTRQLGIMKAIGGQKYQIARMYVGLVFIYGVLGVAIGLPVGLMSGRWFTMFAAEILNFKVVNPSSPTEVLIILLLIGILAPVLASAVPITLGVKKSIVDAFNAASVGTDNFGNSLVDRLLGRIKGMPRPVALSVRSTFAKKGRLAMTLTTLALASGVVMAVFSSSASLNQTVDNISEWWNYDGSITLSRPAPVQLLESTARKLEGVRYVETWMDGRSVIERADGTTNEEYFTLGFPLDTQMIDFSYQEGGYFDGGEPSVIVTSELQNDEPDIQLGSTINILINGKTVQRKVAGIATSSLMGPYMYFEASDLAELMGVAGSATRVVVKGEPGLDGFGQAQLTKRLEKTFEDRGLATATTTTNQQQLETTKDQLGILTTFLFIMAIALAIVGVIGLTGSMTLTVIESTREIGIMRSVGASHGSIFSIFITQGMVVGTLAWIGGAALSYPLSFALIRALETALGMPLAYRFSWFGLVVTLFLMWIISSLGSLLPAWRASQTSIRDAINTE